MLYKKRVKQREGSRVLAKVTVAVIGDFGECLQALTLLNTPLVCYHLVILNFFSLSYKAQNILKQKCQRSCDWKFS